VKVINVLAPVPFGVQCFRKDSARYPLPECPAPRTSSSGSRRRFPAPATDLTGGGDHFRATVVASEFAGLSRIEQHRRVYGVFGAEIGGPIHALSLETRAE
jgi:stress-induced morphogen